MLTGETLSQIIYWSDYIAGSVDRGDTVTDYTGVILLQVVLTGETLSQIIYWSDYIAGSVDRGDKVTDYTGVILL